MYSKLTGYGTVWTAAHLPGRLKKSHYTASNIPKTVDLILMFPEIPMTLRLSGQLLLGVKRIYSKQVDYLFCDCNLFITCSAKYFLSTQVDLPKDARQSPVESVTLPHTLNLDDFDLEEYTLEEGFDNHLWSKEDLILTDQNATGIDPYVAVREDIFPQCTLMGVDGQSTVPVSGHPGDTDVEMAFEAEPNNEPRDFNVNLDTRTYVPRNLTEMLDSSPERSYANSSPSVPEIEIRPEEQQNGRVERTESLDETLNDKEHTMPNIDEEMLNSRGHSTFELRSRSPGFAGSEEERENFGENMRHTLEDPSETLRKRKELASTEVHNWRTNNQPKKDQILNEPMFTDYSDVLGRLFGKQCVASKSYHAVSDEPASVSLLLEKLKQKNDGYHEYMPSPPPCRTDDFTTQPGIWETESYRTEPSTSTYAAQQQLLLKWQKRLFLAFFTCLVFPVLGALLISIDSNTICMCHTGTLFLDVGVRSLASQDSDNLTGRARALAQYLKGHSSKSPTSSYHSGDLSLGKILAGKTRKLRTVFSGLQMFFKTLVLKYRGLIDVQQDQPNSDVTLKLMPAIFIKNCE
ncbi:hypothetical protein EUTSA_v10019442mg [Eutrema salsugineum]|uniref:Rad21/Rec8-like protein N-terminal domain-containing protein n=1 Tax=Eutrema salsugineum TaxID=72664 RepID=V4KFL9_EUTSA|nr:hypothetical protein EUTSA_v10019442mg [Eutrema salsugineum]